MEIKFNIVPPVMPESIQVQMPAHPKQHGLDFNAGKIPVADLTDEQAAEYAELMKQEFLKHHLNRKQKK